MKEKHKEKYILLGLNIAYYRKKHGFSQEALAEMAGISRTYLSNIESPNASKISSLQVLFNIAEVLNVSIVDLIKFK